MLNVKLQRQRKEVDHTRSSLSINEKLITMCVEPPDKGLKAWDKGPHIRRHRTLGPCAIPYGSYEIVFSFSERFERYLPLILDVPGFTDVRFYSKEKPPEDIGGSIHIPNEGEFIEFCDKIYTNSRVQKIILTII